MLYMKEKVEFFRPFSPTHLQTLNDFVLLKLLNLHNEWYFERVDNMQERCEIKL